jgi:cell division protein FtsQ
MISDLLFLFAVTGLGWAAFAWLLSKPFFPLSGVVVVTPVGQITRDQLEYVARTSIHGNFFTAALDDVRAAFENLPWVAHAEVRRRWPDEIELAIEEHQAVAYWTLNDSGETWLVNRQGEVFEAASNADMPVFSGPRGSVPMLLQRYRDYSKVLAPLGVRLTGVDISARAAWQLKLDNGLTVTLGREQDRASLDERFGRFVAAWTKMGKDMNGFSRADLRYPGGFALTPAGAVSAPSAVAGDNRR